MATRLYLTNSTIPSPNFAPGGSTGNWDQTSGIVTKALSATKTGAATTIGIAETSKTNNFDVLLGRWVSEPIRSRGTLQGGITAAIAALESDAAANANLRMVVYVEDVFHNVRGEALDVSSTEIATTATGVAFSGTATSVSVKEYDRVIVEIGYTAVNTSSTSYTGTAYYGGTSGTDMSASDTDTSHPAWIEFADAGFGALFTGSPNGIISFKSVGTVAYGTSSVTITIPAGVEAGDIVALICGAKPVIANAISWSSPSGYSQIITKNNAGGYGTTLGADTGNTSLVVFNKTTVTGSEDGTTVTVTPGGTGGADCCWGVAINLGPSAAGLGVGAYTVLTDTATQTAAGNLGVTFSATPDLEYLDLPIAIFCDPTNAQDGANLSGHAFSATGTSFTTPSEVAEPCTANGNNVAGAIASCYVAGNDTTNNLTWTATAVTTTNVRGPAILLVVRMEPSQTTFNQDAAGSSTPTATVAGKQIQKATQTGSTTPGATIAARTSTKAARTGSTTPTGALVARQITKSARTGSITPSGIVAPTQVHLLATRTGSTTLSGLIKPRTTTRNLLGSTTASGAVTKAVTKATALPGSTTPSGAISLAHFQTLGTASGTTTPSGAAPKTIIKPLHSSITPVGTIGPKEVTYLLTSQLAPSGNMTPLRQSATAMVTLPPTALPDWPILWSVITWEEYVPEGAQVIVETSLNNGATWQQANNGEAIPLLQNGKNVVKALNVRAKLIRQNGTAEAPWIDKININVDTNASVDELVPTGAFLITDTTIEDGAEGLIITLDGMDLSLRVRENGWEGVKVFAAGTNLGDVIKQIILDRDPQAVIGDWASTSLVAPEQMTLGANGSNDPLNDAVQIAQFCGMELFLDYRGRYTLRPQPDPTIDPVVFTFSDRARPTMTRINRRLTRTESFNYIIVSGEATGDIAPVSASAADNDPLSPTYYLGKGGKRVKRVVSKLVTSVADALTMAQGLLLKLKGAGETIDFTVVPNPSLLEGDTVLVDRTGSDLNARYLMDAFTLDFKHDGDMTIAGRRQKLDRSQATLPGTGAPDPDTSGGGTGGTVPRTYQTPGEALKIGTNGNLNHYKLQTAFSGGSDIVERSQAQIGGGYSVNPEFCMNADKTAVNFRVNNNAPTTSGSSNPRSELREMDSNGTGTNGWSPGAGHGLQFTFRVTHASPVNQKVVVMQIHDADDDVLQIMTQKVGGVTKLGYRKNGGSFTDFASYTIGDWVTVKILYTSSTALSIYYHTGTDPTFTGGATVNLTGMTHSGNCYFKAGVYNQISGESSSEYAQVEGKKLGTFHPGQPAPVFDSDTIGTPSGPSSFTLAFSACINANASAAGSLTHIKNAGPDYFAILGDFWYKDGAAKTWEDDWTRQMGYSNFASLIAALPNPIIVGWSDHDFGYNNNVTGVGAGSSHVNAANTAYRNKFGSSGPGVQNATLPSSGIYRTWVVGRIRFVLLDMLSFKSTLGTANSSSRTMLGSTQKAWFKNILATASEPLIVVLGDGQIPGPAEDGQDEWRGYAAERSELASALNARPKPVIYLNGDTHSLAYGSNQYGYDKVWQSAPLHNTTKVKAGGQGYTATYPTNDTESDTTVSELYAIVTFSDTGSQISCTYKGYEGTTVRLTDTFTVNG